MICALLPVLRVRSQVYLTEGFEIGARPAGWTEEYVSGMEPWRYRNGGHSPNDNNWQVPPEQIDITRNPPSAYEGSYNAIFFKQGDNNERTKLITPQLNLMGGASVELSFYLCQIPWTFEGATGWDVLRVYYKVSESSPWVLLHEYLDPVYEWTEQTLVLRNLSSTYYIAFEGHTRWGYGTCIDNISIEEKGSQPLWIKEIDFQQPFPVSVPSGSVNVPVMRIEFRVFGNAEEAFLQNIQFTSLNTSDDDLRTGGVKLYSTLNQTFTTDNPLGSPANFVSGRASFTGLNHSLPPGQSYLWLAYDLKPEAPNGNIIDVMVAANSILANDTLYPAAAVSPAGSRTIYATQYFEDFEGAHNWNLTGEFEVDAPGGLGGIPGNPDPSRAFSGSKILGTDLTGLGAYPYNYEPDISEAVSYLATSPTLNLFYYKNLNLFFQRYLNIEVWDNSSIQISLDDGASWNNIWENTSYLSDFQWTQQQIQIPDIYSRTDKFKLRFKLGPTDSQNNYSGWNIDDVFVTGEFISKDVGVTEWIYPQSGSGHTQNDSVTVRIANYGGAEITDPVPVAYSFDGGATWTVDNMTRNIPVGGSVVFTFPTRTDLSAPGWRPSVLARTMLPGDQFTDNDHISTQIYIVPTYPSPYHEDFETNDGFWRSLGNNIWEYGTPSGNVINEASSGTESWVTGLTQKYGDLISQKNRIIFEDTFESDLGWTFTGEFERNIPDNMHLPFFAWSGYYCIGTDLSGKGTLPYYYENGITQGTAYTALSPPVDVRDYSNLMVSFVSWTTIRDGDSIRLEVSPDNGLTWGTLWKNSEGEIMDEDFIYREFAVHDSLSHSQALRFRFSLFWSSPSGPTAEGWNIDDFLLTGDLVNIETGYLTSPSFDLTGLVNPVFEARLWIDTEQNVDGATMLYSLDDGHNWTTVSNSSDFDEYWNWYTGKPVQALGSNGWSGQSSGWITVRHLLPSILTDQKNVQFRFIFSADKFNNDFDGIAIDDIKIIEAPYDVGITEILEPVTACELSADQRFTLRLRNFGINTMQTGDSIRINYHIDRSGEIQTAEETIYLAQPFLPGTSRDFSMTSVFDFSASGEYQTNVTVIEDDPVFYEETSNNDLFRLIRVNRPVVNLGPDVSTLRPDTVVFKAYSNVAGYSYLWQDGSTDSTFHASTEGTYWVRVTSDLGCVASDTALVTQLIADMGIVELLSPFHACELGPGVPVRITIQNFGTDTVKVNDTLFVSREINAVALRDTLIFSEEIVPGSIMEYTFSQDYDFSLPGTYYMKMYTRFRDDFRNYNDTLEYTLEVYGYPPVDLGPDMVLMAPDHLLSAPEGYHTYLWQDGSAMSTFVVDQPGQYLYHVTVSDEHGCSASDSVLITLNVIDIALDQIISPETSCGLSETVTVTARVRNTGNQIIPEGGSISMGYLIDGGSLTEESIILAEALLPGAAVDHEFSQKALVVTGEWYDFTVYASYAGDMKTWNDTILMPVGVFESPVVDLGDEFLIITATEYVLDAGPGFVSYLWHDGSTDQTFTINSPGINNCSVTVTDNNGCTGYDEILIMLVVPDIGVVEVVQPQTSCSGEAGEYVMVGIKNLGNTDIDQSAQMAVSYSINGMAAVNENIVLTGTFENGSVIYHTFTQQEDFSAPGLYELTATTVYGDDLIPSNDALTINFEIFAGPVPDLGSGQDTIIVYAPVTLSVPAGYASYLWQDGSTASDYSISDPGASLYSVVVTDNNGCVAEDSVYVAYDVPDIGITGIISPVSSCSLSGDTPVSLEVVNNGFYRILQGEMITMTYIVDGGLPVTEVYQLTGTLNPGQSRVLTFADRFDFSEIRTYQLNVNIDYGPDENPANNSISSSVHVWGNPVVEIAGGKDTLLTSLPVLLDAGAGFASYLWQDNSEGSTYNAIHHGLHRVIVTDTNGCSARDSVYLLSVTGIEDPSIFPGEITIYPNPANDILNVLIELEGATPVTVELYNIQGILLIREDYKQTEIINEKIDVTGMPAGPYILRIKTDTISRVFRVVVI